MNTAFMNAGKSFGAGAGLAFDPRDRAANTGEEALA